MPPRTDPCNSRLTVAGLLVAAVLTVVLMLLPVRDAEAATVSSDPVVAALAETGEPSTTIALPTPSEKGAYVAKILRASTVRTRPRPDARRIGVARDRTDYLNQGNRLIVLAARYDKLGRPWLRVQLPIRPNETSGWMLARDAVVSRTPWGVRVRLGRRELTVLYDGKVVRRVSVVVGTAATPTPRGTFAIYEVAPQKNPGAFTGPWALNLTGFSTVLENFGSGPGRVAIHGRSGASLNDPLGTARSHGCIRVDNATVEWLRRRLANGTPVRITTR
jgi:type IV pilus biogenesis protein CpaD/CtpE